MPPQVNQPLGRRRFLFSLTALPALSLIKNVAASSSGKMHHLSDGTFCNSNGQAINKPFSQLLKWRREAPKVEMITFPLAPNNPSYLQANRSEPTLTWVGHATFLIQLNGVNILTDPHFSQRASPFSFTGPKRNTPPGIAFDQLPPIDVVLVTHNHYDHLDAETVAALVHRHQPRFIVPLKLGGAVSRWGGVRIAELDWGGQQKIGDVCITAEPCHHWSARGIFDRNETLWASYVIAAQDFRLFFIGDTGYSADFVALGEKYSSFDVAMIPIGAYEPRWFMKEAHINPDESVRIFQALRARYAVASHWGVFSLTNEPMNEPPQKLRAALAAAGIGEDAFAVWQHGESRSLHSRQRLL